MAADFGVQFQPAVGHRAHKIDPSSRTVCLLAQFEIRWTGGSAQPAMDEVEDQLVIDSGAATPLSGPYDRRFQDRWSRSAHVFRVANVSGKFSICRRGRRCKFVKRLYGFSGRE